MRALPRLTATALITACTLLTAAVPICIVVPSLMGASRSLVEASASERLQASGKSAADQIARALATQWRELKAIGEFARAGEPSETLRTRLEAVKAVNPRYAWIGLADTAGRVVTATGRLLEGQSVADRAWFTAGSHGPFAGDLHEALLLKSVLVPSGSEPPRLLDLATPISRNGELAGVIGGHVTWEWMADLVRQIGLDSGVSLTLVARDGTVLVSTSAPEGRQLTTSSIFAARLGTAATTIERWENGSEQLVTVVPTISIGDLPSFGWSLIANVPAEAAFSPARRMTATLAYSLGASAIAVLLGSFLLGRTLGRPLVRMAAAAASAASNTCDGPVPDERGFREVAELSASLSRLQSRIRALEGPATAQPRLPRAGLVFSGVDA
jgi:hypothetical protein